MKSVSCQLEANARANLLRDDLREGIVIDTEFLAALQRFAATPMDSSRLDELSHHAAGQFSTYVLAINPYIDIHDGDREELANMYRQSARLVAGGTSPREVLMSLHYPALRQWIEKKYPLSIKEALRQKTELGSVSYAEYSAELQLRALGLSPADFTSPVLDLGCGAEAFLVRYLRDHGIEAYGLDRALPESTGFLFSMSWFDLPFGNLKVENVVSHLAYSSHLLYQQTTGGPELGRYLERYYAILAALHSGGLFAYAPALPFLEDTLPEKEFAVTRRTVVDKIEATHIRRRR